MAVAEAQGMGESVADRHYGNNVVTVGAEKFTITLDLNGQTSTFTVIAAV